MSVDFTQAIKIAKLSAGRYSKQYRLDYDTCLSEAYLAISSKLGGFDPEKSQLGSYVTRVVHCQIIDYLRSEFLTLRGKLTTSWAEGQEVGCLDNANLDDDASVVVQKALDLAAAGSKPKTIRSKLRAALASEGWPENRIAEAFDSVAEGLGNHSFVLN